MSEPFLAEIRIIGFNFAPRGWAFCDGQVLPINQNQSLYSLLGTTYGGDGRTSFALPDLRGRTPIHENGAHPLGESSGEETHTITGSEMPQHAHSYYGSSSPADTQEPVPNTFGATSGDGTPDQAFYKENPTPAEMRDTAVQSVGGGQAHNNMMPFLALNFCIALQGLFPSRN